LPVALKVAFTVPLTVELPYCMNNEPPVVDQNGCRPSTSAGTCSGRET
jgi:hypothetical protein